MTVPLQPPPACPAGDQAPDDTELAGLFRQYHTELVRLAVLMVRDQPTAEDVVQDVFTRVCGRVGFRPQPGRELAYLRAGVLNGCRSVHRRHAVARRIGIERGVARTGGADQDDADGRTAGERHHGAWPTAHESAESAAIRAEERRAVLVALAALPSRRREVLVLRYYLGLTEAEIAATLRISPGAVKSAAARGLAALARRLGDDE